MKQIIKTKMNKNSFLLRWPFRSYSTSTTTTTTTTEALPEAAMDGSSESLIDDDNLITLIVIFIMIIVVIGLTVVGIFCFIRHSHNSPDDMNQDVFRQSEVDIRGQSNASNVSDASIKTVSSETGLPVSP